jgi:hypothetical protein
LRSITFIISVAAVSLAIHKRHYTTCVLSWKINVDLRKENEELHELLTLDFLLRVCSGTFSARHFLTDISIWGGADRDKVGLIRIQPTSRDKMVTMRDKQKCLNNFPTTGFIKNQFPQKGRLGHLKHLCGNGFLINVVSEELFKTLHLPTEDLLSCEIDLIENLSSDGMTWLPFVSHDSCMMKKCMASHEIEPRDTPCSFMSEKYYNHYTIWLY